jgi:hypothetical protein
VIRKSLPGASYFVSIFDDLGIFCFLSPPLLTSCLVLWVQSDVLVLAKLPLGLFVPKFESIQQPDGFPFNPYRRDVAYASVAMTCRGEFSFVIAAFALSENLFTPELYSSIVFSVLLSSITSPFVLLSIIKYYNQKTEQFLALTLVPEDSKDNKIPLYLSIQIRSPNQWGLQETISHAIRRANLIVIDHRSWHPRGLNATVISELYAEDSNVRIPLPKQVTATLDVVDEHDEENEDASSIKDKVNERCDEIKKCIESALGHDEETRITVSWWQPNALAEHAAEVENFEELSQSLKNIIKLEANDHITMHQLGTEIESAAELRARLRNRGHMITPKVGEDMWHQDTLAQQVAMDDAIRPLPPAIDATGRYRHTGRRKVQSDLSGFLLLENVPTAEERLAGFVRRENAESAIPATPYARYHPGERNSRNLEGAPNNAESGDENAAFRRVKMKSDLTGFFTAEVAVNPRTPGGSRTQQSGGDAEVNTLQRSPSS